MRNRVLALGTDNKTTFTLIDGDLIHTGKAYGDLTRVDSYTAFQRDVESTMRKNDFTPDIIACDMHPDLRSTVLAEKMAAGKGDIRLVRVQHHFAHIAACMEDNGIDEEVIGVAFDGTGYGADGTMWGGEFLVCDRSGFTRRFHLDPVPQPGGDAAVRENWRMALAYLDRAFGPKLAGIKTPVLERIDSRKRDIITRMIRTETNCPGTSSMGRLFDAVSSILGLRDETRKEAEAAIALEKETAGGVRESYEYDILGERILVDRMIRAMCFELSRGTGVDLISAKFHNTIGDMIADVAGLLSHETGIEKVLVSGGCFQNRYLREYMRKKFRGSDLELVEHKDLTPTDLNVSVGQAAVAARIGQGTKLTAE
jgi:hydrogenase maturation protein HypF